MSAPEREAASAGVWLADCRTDIVELAAFSLAAADAQRRVAGVELPPFGHAGFTGGHLALSVRPARWLLLSAPAEVGSAAGRWAKAAQGQGAAVDLTSGLAAFVLAGASARELLARGCRLDLDPAASPTGYAGATYMAQVSVILAVLPQCLLLLTPASTSRHLREWLVHSAAPFGLMRAASVSLSDIFGESST
ncbi:MAG: hypothetical protein JSS29_01375 [Proteobacteria bacterium]|nr:hypothetical protein [Pseudomonadota bacterium]